MIILKLYLGWYRFYFKKESLILYQRYILAYNPIHLKYKNYFNNENAKGKIYFQW
jgi:hypothetical protein